MLHVDNVFPGRARVGNMEWCARCDSTFGACDTSTYGSRMCVPVRWTAETHSLGGGFLMLSRTDALAHLLQPHLASEPTPSLLSPILYLQLFPPQKAIFDSCR